MPTPTRSLIVGWSGRSSYRSHIGATDGPPSLIEELRSNRDVETIMQRKSGRVRFELSAKSTADLIERKDRVAKEVTERPAPTERRPVTQESQFEHTISAASPRAQKWLREHPEYVTDQKLNQKANAAHLNAMAEGFIPDTDAYFDYCERALGMKTEDPKPSTNGAKPEAKPAQVRDKPMVSAPVSRSGVLLDGSLSPSQVVLSAGEQKAATDGTIVWNQDNPKTGAKKGDPIGLKEYARRKSSMTKDGLYDPSFTNQ